MMMKMKIMAQLSILPFSGQESVGLTGLSLQGVVAGMNDNEQAVEDILRGLASQISEREDPFMCSDVRYDCFLFNLTCFSKVSREFAHLLSETSFSARWNSLDETSPPST